MNLGNSTHDLKSSETQRSSDLMSASVRQRTPALCECRLQIFVLSCYCFFFLWSAYCLLNLFYTLFLLVTKFFVCGWGGGLGGMGRKSLMLCYLPTNIPTCGDEFVAYSVFLFFFVSSILLDSFICASCPLFLLPPPFSSQLPTKLSQFPSSLFHCFLCVFCQQILI